MTEDSVAGDTPMPQDHTMADVAHEPPAGEGANRAFERGTEGRTETV